MNIALLGPPGAGKGTIARQLCSDYGLTLFAAGEILRNEGKTGSDLGKEILSYIDNGFAPPSKITVELVCRELLKAKGGVLLDNFPRNMEQTEAFENFRIENDIALDVVLYVTAPIDVLLDRVFNRLVCSKCETPYNLKYAPPKVEGICDICGAQIIKRADDTPEKMANRVKVFMDTTLPVIDYYYWKGMLSEIKSVNSPLDAYQRAKIAIGTFRH